MVIVDNIYLFYHKRLFFSIVRFLRTCARYAARGLLSFRRVWRRRFGFRFGVNDFKFFDAAFTKFPAHNACQAAGIGFIYIRHTEFCCVKSVAGAHAAYARNAETGAANGLVRFQCSVPMYIQVLKLKKVTAYEKQMLRVVLSFKRQGDSSNCCGTWYSVFTRPRSAVLLYHAQEAFVKAGV